MDDSYAQQLIQQQIQTILQMNLPFPQQLETALAFVKNRAPADLVEQILSTIDQLLTLGIAEQALKEGEHAPDFTLPDALGNAMTLSNLLTRGPVILTFYRGAWCPYCNLQLHAYQQVLPQIQALGASLVAISPQTPDQSLSLAEKYGLAFAVLSDVGNQVARAYRLVFTIDEAVRTAHKQVGADLPTYNGDESWELPIPGTFLLDQSGTVRLAFVDPNYTHRLDPSILLERLISLTGERTPVEGL
ncbi:peroxiredoxin-like family protein [Ktedonospora formicarum]|uniref:thioredoxin-dependent peroxiredoxin n=1 Tax=Ktedonospora formicarum TaxID=2778364 RepID=A0A8J3I3S7_9CHLR|nr:peroxiredoxin-like family protein [Ktedonospora formicarum]GHO47026.1 alkyl hydroperoxide reductase [Ktedonospora formicarum]